MTRSVRLRNCPSSGEGVHKRVYYAACTCVDAGLTNDEAEEIIEEMMTRDPNPPSEIEDALRSARGERKSAPHWASPIPQLIAKIASEGPTLTELASPFAASP